MEEKIGNHKQPKLIPTAPNLIHYTSFGNNFDDNELILHFFGDDIINASKTKA